MAVVEWWEVIWYWIYFEGRANRISWYCMSHESKRKESWGGTFNDWETRVMGLPLIEIKKGRYGNKFFWRGIGKIRNWVLNMLVWEVFCTNQWQCDIVYTSLLFRRQAWAGDINSWCVVGIWSYKTRWGSGGSECRQRREGDQGGSTRTLQEEEVGNNEWIRLIGNDHHVRQKHERVWPNEERSFKSQAGRGDQLCQLMLMGPVKGWQLTTGLPMWLSLCGREKNTFGGGRRSWNLDWNELKERKLRLQI